MKVDRGKEGGSEGWRGGEGRGGEGRGGEEGGRVRGGWGGGGRVGLTCSCWGTAPPHHGPHRCP